MFLPSFNSILTFYSYRDPKNLETFSVYQKSADWLLGDNFDQNDVNEAILRVFQGVDAPVTPGSRGMRHFLSGVSDEMFANHRLALKNVTVADIKAAFSDIELMGTVRCHLQDVLAIVNDRSRSLALLFAYKEVGLV